MPFPPTPSQTPSNTPTPSITPSNTPSYTPTGTSCPGSSPSVTSTPTPTQTQTQTGTGGLLITPTPTSTQTQTPSSTGEPIAEYYYYEIVKYDCNNSCTVVPPDLVGRSSSVLSTVDGMYRKIGDFVYQVQNIAEVTVFDIDLDTATNTSLDCYTACNPTFYYSYTVRLNADSIEDTCSSPVVVVFSTSSTFAPGITLYSDDTVPTLLTGYRYVSSFLDGNVYNLDITTGVVGIDTGYDC